MKTAGAFFALMGIARVCFPAVAFSQELERTGAKVEVSAPASGGQVWVQVTPWKRTLGKNQVARVEAIFPRGSRDIVFFAAQGAITDVEMASPTHAKAKYHVPSSYLPQLDIIAAMATVENEKRWGFATVLLIGLGEAEIKTRAGKDAFITIGEELYGPQKADGGGSARIQIEVPPGVQFGRDENGNPVDLRVPKTARTAVFPAIRKIVAGTVDKVNLYGVVVAKDGFLDDVSPIAMDVDRGTIVDLHSTGGGSFTAFYVPPAEYRGVVKIRAFVPGDDAPPAELELEIADSFAAVDFDIKEIKENKKYKDKLDYNAYATAKIGFARDFSSLGSFSLGADVGASLNLLGEKFAAGLESGLLLGSKASTVYVNDISSNEIKLESEVTTLIFPIAATLGWFHALSGEVGLWLLVQGGFVVINNRINTTSDSQGAEEVQSVDVQISHRNLENLGLLGAGTALEWSVGLGAFYLGLRWMWYPGSAESVRGFFSSINLDLGYRFWFL